MRIHWNQNDLIDPKNDLCTCINGVYADIIRNEIDNSWHCLWNSCQRFGPFDTRDKAIIWFDSVVKDLKLGKVPILIKN